MSTGAKPKRSPGKPRHNPEERMTTRTYRATNAQKEKVDKLGGAAWIRKQIDAASVK